MLDILFKNKELSSLAFIALAFYAWSSYQDAQKTKLEIELLKIELEKQQPLNI